MPEPQSANPAPPASPALRALYLEYALNAVGLVPHMVFLVDFIARDLGEGLHEAARYWVIFGVGALITGIGWGLVETVVNPLIATLYPDEKTGKLNALHAWWPGGIVIGEAESTFDFLPRNNTSWRVLSLKESPKFFSDRRAGQFARWITLI